jgi:tetrahydromethanopterin S-methyltransferase subunit G
MMISGDVSMSVIEDSRKLLQDFIAPELRAISARLDALERRFDLVDRRIDEVDRRAEKRHDELMSAIRQVIDLNSIQQRLARLESRDSAQHQ